MPGEKKRDNEKKIKIKMINWNTPKFGKNEKIIVNNVLDSGYVSEGPMTEKLEKKLADIVGTKHVIMTTSCTAALYLAIETDKRIRGYDEGEIIIPDLTFVATKNAVEMARLKPKIVDVGEDRFLIKSSTAVGNAKTIIPVNLLGRNFMIPYPKVEEDFPDMTFIYDNAGALGSNVRNGKVGCYSLQANKIISCGQGGFCATDDDKYAKIIRQIKDFGRKEKKENNTKGFNLKFNDLLAAVALGQLEKLEKRKDLHRKQYLRYLDGLSGPMSNIQFISWDFDKGETPLWIEIICKKRDKLLDYLLAEGIKARKPWNPIQGLPNALKYSKEVLWLPNGPNVSNEDIDFVIKKIKKFYGN